MVRSKDKTEKQVLADKLAKPYLTENSPQKETFDSEFSALLINSRAVSRVLRKLAFLPFGMASSKVQVSFPYNTTTKPEDIGCLRAFLERTTRLELATSTLARWRSTR